VTETGVPDVEGLGGSVLVRELTNERGAGTSSPASTTTVNQRRRSSTIGHEGGVSVQFMPTTCEGVGRTGISTA
jgi:hypothetical protein